MAFFSRTFHTLFQAVLRAHGCMKARINLSTASRSISGTNLLTFFAPLSRKETQSKFLSSLCQLKRYLPLRRYQNSEVIHTQVDTLPAMSREFSTRGLLRRSLKTRDCPRLLQAGSPRLLPRA